MNTITRRTALAIPITLPLIPLASYAALADPAIEAYRKPTLGTECRLLYRGFGQALSG